MVQSYELSMNQIVLDNCYSTFRRFETFIELGLLCNIFSESELAFTFAICYRPSVCRLYICNARALYSAGWNFRQYVYAIWYLVHPLTSTENFTEIVLGEPMRWGGGDVKCKRGCQI